MFNLFKILNLNTRSSVSVATEEKILREWQNIETLLREKKPSQLRQALIAADKSLDFALKDLVSGETMGERLKNAFDKFDKVFYNKIWNAHKIRNNLVHEPGYEPPYFVITEAVDILKLALIKLGVRL